MINAKERLSLNSSMLSKAGRCRPTVQAAFETDPRRVAQVTG